MKEYSQDEKRFIHRLEEKVERATQWYSEEITDFLEPSLQIIAEEHLRKWGAQSYGFMGGYGQAERKRLVILSEYEDIEQHGGEIQLIKLTGNFQFVQVSHRDFLGAILGLGIKREKIGDLLVHEQGCDVVVCQELSDYFLIQPLRIKGVPIKATVAPLEQITLPEVKTKELSVMVSSMRLDTIVAYGFGLSRNQGSGFIESGKVKVNWREVEANDYLCKEGDQISCRGKGKIVLSQCLGNTKKGKIRLILTRYI